MDVELKQKGEYLNSPRGKPWGGFTGRIKKAISSSLANPAASGEECARYRGSIIDGSNKELSP